MFSEVMGRVLGGAALALSVLAGLADPPGGHYTCIAAYGCNTSNCPSKPPCGANQCAPTHSCPCSCADYIAEELCGCTVQ